MKKESVYEAGREDWLVTRLRWHGRMEHVFFCCQPFGQGHSKDPWQSRPSPMSAMAMSADLGALKQKVFPTCLTLTHGSITHKAGLCRDHLE